MPRLRVCDECSRHVFVDETSCPFCGAELAPAAASPALALPAGLSRAQRFALTAAVVSQAALGCTETRSIPVYGAPFNEDVGPGTAGKGGAAAAAGSSGSAGVVAIPIYGASPVPTAGTGAAGTRGSAGSAGGPIAVPAYGAPFIDAGTPPDDDAGTE